MRNQIHIVVITALAVTLAACAPSDEVTENLAGPVREQTLSVTTDVRPVSVKKTYTLVMLGDSLTAGLGLSPGEAFSDVIQRDFDRQEGNKIRVLNAGVSGDTSASGLARFDWSVGPKANGVLIALGANDMLNGLDPAQTRKNLIAMIEKARIRKLDVFLAGMRAAPNLGIDYGRAFDRIYTGISAQYCVPLFAFLMQPLASKGGASIDQSLIQDDGLHPTKEGAARIGHALSGWLSGEMATFQIPCDPNNK